MTFVNRESNEERFPSFSLKVIQPTSALASSHDQVLQKRLTTSLSFSFAKPWGLDPHAENVIIKIKPGRGYDDGTKNTNTPGGLGAFPSI
jgi:hypothetical protein